jgi:hypothetical protein
MAKTKPLPALEVLRERFVYDPESGLLKYRMTGCEAGWLNTAVGYRYVNLSRKSYLVHRVAWFMYYSVDPGSKQVDHVDGNPHNNSISNLRLASQGQNTQNSRVRCRSGLKGAYFEHGKYTARLKFNKTTLYLGRFDTAEEAHAAYMDKARELFGEFACDAERARSREGGAERAGSA